MGRLTDAGGGESGRGDVARLSRGGDNGRAEATETVLVGVEIAAGGGEAILTGRGGGEAIRTGRGGGEETLSVGLRMEETLAGLLGDWRLVGRAGDEVGGSFGGLGLVATNMEAIFGSDSPVSSIT